MPRSDLLGLTPYFHVICRGNNRSPLFQNHQDFEVFRGRLRKYKTRWPFDIYHYVLMTTHVHLEVHADQLIHLSRALHGIQFTYCLYFQGKYPLVGHLWHSRFRSNPILSEEHLIRCGRYIEINPIHASLANHPTEYPWSSYHVYASGRNDDLVTVNPFYLSLGATIEERRLMYKEYIEDGMRMDWKEEREIFEPRGRPGRPPASLTK